MSAAPSLCVPHTVVVSAATLAGTCTTNGARVDCELHVVAGIDALGFGLAVELAALEGVDVLTGTNACGAELPRLGDEDGRVPRARVSALCESHESIAVGSQVSPLENLITTGTSVVLTVVLGVFWATNGFLPTIV